MSNLILLFFAAFRLISSDPQGFVGEYELSSMDTTTVVTDKGEFFNILSDELLIDGDVGSPPQYYRKIMFILPQAGGFHVSLEPLDVEKVYLKNPLLPVPRFEDDGMSERYEMSDDYLKDKEFPDVYYRVLGTGIIGGLRYGEVAIYPIRYNPRRKTLKILRKIRVKVTFDSKPHDVKGRNSHLEAIQRLNFVNYAAGKNWRINKATPLDWQDPFSNATTWVKIAVYGEGVYEIDFDDLRKLGINEIPSDQIALYSLGGITLPSDVDSANLTMKRVGFLLEDGGDGVFGPGDRLLFYGIPMQRYVWNGEEYDYFNHPYSDTNFYWLGLYARPGDGLVLTPSQGVSGNRLITCTRFYRHEQELFNIAQKGLWWIGEMIQRDAGNRTASMSFHFNLSGVADSNATFEIQLIGGDKYQMRYVDVILNGDSIATTSLSGLTSKKIVVDYHHLRASNELTLVIYPSEFDTLWRSRSDYVFLDYFNIKYTATTSAQADTSIFFESAHGDVEVSVPQSVVRVWGVSNGVAPSVFTVSNGQFGATVDAGDVFYLESSTQKPAYMRLYFPSHLRERDVNGVRYLAVVPSVFKGVFSRYANWRRNHIMLPTPDGHWEVGSGTMLTVTTENIFDEFGFGIKDPVAIRNFVRYVYDNDDSLLYLTLVGDGHYDYKGYTTTFGNFVPPYEPFYLLNIESQLGALDIFYADMNGDDYPDIFIGRIPIRYRSELSDYLQKVRVYESGDATGLWRDRVLLVADDEYGENQNIGGDTQHMYYINMIYNHWIPHTMDVSHVYEIEFPRPAPRVRLGASEAFISEFNRGASMVVIFIHGHPAQLSHEKLFDLQRDAGKINAGRKNAFVFVASCKVGGFDRIKYPRSITEDWTLRPGGAIAAVSSTVGEFHSTNMRVFEGMVSVLRTDSLSHPFGELLTQGIINSRGFYFVLFGDPATPYSFVYPQLDVTADDTLQRGRRSAWSVSGLINTSSRFLYVNALGTRKDVTYHSPDGVTVIHYTQPPVPFFVGKASFDGDSAHGAFWIPVSVDTGAHANLIVYDPASVWGKAGNADNRVIIRENRVIIDTMGASIELLYKGRKLSDGDTIRNNIPVEIKVSDDLGINLSHAVRPNEPGLSLWYSLNPNPVDLTQLFEYDIDSDTSGSAYYTLNFGEDGQQSLTIREYDIYENPYSRVWNFYVTGEDRLAISDLLVYPNPITSDGNVIISFRLSISALVEVKIWTLGGRKIWDSGERLLSAGYNEILWNGYDLDGEMPSNGLYFVTVESEANGVRKSSVQRFAIAK